MKNSNIKLLPHILVRLGGMSFDVLEELNYSEKFLEELAELEKRSIEFRQVMEDLINHLKTFSTNDVHFKSIRKIKKLVSKSRLVNTASVKPLNEITAYKILTYNEINTSKKQQLEIVTALFELEHIHSQVRLQTVSKHKNLQNALPLSSVIFAKQYLKYLEKEPVDFRKKEYQIEQKLFQFLSRTAAKTSPFSSFTPVCYGKLARIEGKNNIAVNDFEQILDRQLEWNNYLLELFKLAFKNNAAIFPFLNIRLNTTLKSVDDNYTFLVNQHNLERFQTLEKQTILDFFETVLRTSSDLTISLLIDKLQEIIEIETADLVEFIRELIEIGFIEINFSFHQKSSIWLKELIAFSSDIPILKSIGIPFFMNMQTAIQTFKLAKIKERITILERSFEAIEKFLIALKEDTISFDLKTAISLEQLIYEDTAYQGSITIEASKCKQLISQLNELLSNLNFIKGKGRLQIEYFFDHNYEKEEVVSVLDFYKNYYQNGKLQLEKEKVESIKKEGKLINDWVKLATDLLLKKYAENGKVSLEITDFQNINQQLNIIPFSLENSSFSCFAQFYESKNELKAVLNAVSLGFGKMTGRFLDLMPNEFYKDLKLFNQANEGNFIQAEQKDATFFNANIHQNLFNYELNTHQFESAEKQQINIEDLVVRKKEQRIILWHSRLKKEVRFYDLGMQTPKGRSPLYQLLLNFSPVMPSFYYLEKVFNRFTNQLDLENRFSPAIYFENWILKRASWKIPYLRNTESIKNLSSFEIYQKCQNWRKENNLIKKNYYINNIKSTGNQVVKNTKPIYISFNNLIAFQKGLHQTNETAKALEMKEMKPNEKELIRILNRNFVAEFNIQWYNK